MFDRLLFVTSSAHKLREAEAILAVRLERLHLDLPELQGLDVLAIARAKAHAAYREVGAPVLVEDTSLELAALGGFPGPLIRWLMEAAGPAALAPLLDGFTDRGATARCVAVVVDGDREWVGEGVVPGRIADRPRGAAGFGWDVVFVPAWDGRRTYAEMPAAEKNERSHRAAAFRALRDELAVRP